jgi:hypothetical protein
MAAKKSSARKPAKASARKPAKKTAARAASRPASAKASPAGGAAGVVYSDVRRDALAWQLSKLR